MSTANAEKIVNKIKELPPLPFAIQKLLAVVEDGGSSAKDLSAVISTDQALTSNVLKLVNSAFYGFPRKISTITQAVVILGYSAVRSLALAFASCDALKKLGDDEDQRKFWEHALTCAVGAQALAPSLNYPEPEQAFIAALLHDVGHLILRTILPDEYREIYANADNDVLAKEEDLLGMTHMEVGTRLFEQWQLPEMLCRVARFHHSAKLGDPEKEPLISLVMLSDILATVRGYTFGETVDVNLLIQITEGAGISMGEYGKALAVIDGKIKEAMASLGIALRPNKGKGESGGDENTAIAIISRDEQRIQWVKGVLESFGYTALVVNPTEEFRCSGVIRLAIFDPLGLQGIQTDKLSAALKEKMIPAAALTDNGAAPADGRPEVVGYPGIPFIFTRHDVGRLLQKEPANGG
jgi:HD-like signal output (HDOD) protein